MNQSELPKLYTQEKPLSREGLEMIICLSLMLMVAVTGIAHFIIQMDGFFKDQALSERRQTRLMFPDLYERKTQ